MKHCKKCNGEFPTSIVVDGKRIYLNKRKFCLTCSPFGKKNRRDLEKLGISKDGFRICLKCKGEKINGDFYYHSGKSNLRGTCKDCEKKDREKRLDDFKKECIEYKGGKCIICGYDKCPASMDFHHRTRFDKEFNISEMRFGYKVTEEVIQELDKCDLLCKNCHNEVHSSKK